VVDGDGREIHETRIRTFGIDAPQSDICRDTDSDLYRCGAKAANALDNFLDQRVVVCTSVNLDRHQRTVVCPVGASDIGVWLVRNGYSLCLPFHIFGNLPNFLFIARHYWAWDNICSDRRRGNAIIWIGRFVLEFNFSASSFLPLSRLALSL
jgi:hypothetical protein